MIWMMFHENNTFQAGMRNNERKGDYYDIMNTILYNF